MLDWKSTEENASFANICDVKSMNERMAIFGAAPVLPSFSLKRKKVFYPFMDFSPFQ